MPTQSSKMGVINLSGELGKSRFWGRIHADSVRIFIQEKIIKLENNIVTVDLKGIEDFDPLFGESVFVDLVKSINSESEKVNTILFADPANEEIDFKLETVLKENSVFAAMKRGHSITIIGDVSYPSKVIFQKLLNYSPIAPEVLCDEIGENEAKCTFQLEEFATVGLARKTKRNLYVTTLHLKGVAADVRRFVKSIKMFFYRKPVLKALDANP